MYAAKLAGPVVKNFDNARFTIYPDKRLVNIVAHGEAVNVDPCLTPDSVRSWTQRAMTWVYNEYRTGGYEVWFQ